MGVWRGLPLGLGQHLLHFPANINDGPVRQGRPAHWQAGDLRIVAMLVHVLAYAVRDNTSALNRVLSVVS